jgi:GT2 family glycosyltransferase
MSHNRKRADDRGPPLRWIATGRQIAERSVTLGASAVPPGWYRIRAEVGGGPAIVSVTAQFTSGNPPLRLRLESRPSGAYARILRLSDTACAVTVTAEGATMTGIARIGVAPMGKAAVIKFIAVKGLRYLVARRGRLDPGVALKLLRNAIRPSANFVFRSRYQTPDDAESYPRWRAIHESADAGARAAGQLAVLTAGKSVRIGVLTATPIDGAAMLNAAAQSLTGRNLTIEAVSAADLARRPADWDFILPVDRAGVFAEGAIERLALALMTDPGLDAVFADSDLMSPTGERLSPRLKPPWDRELLWSQDYIGVPLLLRWRSDLLSSLDGPAAARKPGYALALALLDQRLRSALSRVHGVLFHERIGLTESGEDRKVLEEHLRRSGAAAGVQKQSDGVLHVAWALPSTPPGVSIIIPSRDHPQMLKQCIDTIREQTEAIVPEIIVADNGSVLPETIAALGDLAARGIARIVPCPGPFNFSKINNQARQAASGDVLILLNDDTRVLSAGWLGELASLAIRPTVGAVGAMLLYPDGTVQHAGILLGVGGGVAEHAFRHWPGDSAGYLGLLRCRREASAVTGACLAVSAAHYDLVGGLDESLPVTLNDVDFCLKLGALGLINIWTPWARLEHLESKTRGLDRDAAQMARLSAELRLFAERWPELPPRDAFYHPGLSDLSPDYRLAV